MTQADEARVIILNSVAPAGIVTMALDRSLHHALAERVVADTDIPSFDNAAMDGFAVRADDVRSGTTTLRLAGEVAAGARADTPLRPGETMAIMTGAKIPPECDAVVQQEWSRRVSDTEIEILRSVEAGHNIRRKGADLAYGSTVFEIGTVLRAQELGVLASLGKTYPTVYRSVRVAILATGNELVEVDAPVAGEKIRNSNAHTLAALVRECDAEPVMLGIAADEREALRTKIMQGLTADMLITTGGVSVGKYDLVLDVMKEIGVEIKFWKVNIKPGMPLLFGMYGGTAVFGLPGNPVSTAVTFLQFVRCALRKMMGTQGVTQMRLRAALEHEFTKSDGKRHFVRGILESRDGTLYVRSTGSQVSNILSSLTKANCLIIIPEDIKHLRAGEHVDVELL